MKNEQIVNRFINEGDIVWANALDVLDCIIIDADNKDHRLKDGDIKEIRKEFKNIKEDEEILFLRDLTFWNIRTQGCVITDYALHFILDKNKPESVFSLKWSDIKTIKIDNKKFCISLYDNTIHTIEPNLFIKKKDPSDRMMERVASFLNEIAYMTPYVSTGLIDGEYFLDGEVEIIEQTETPVSSLAHQVVSLPSKATKVSKKSPAVPTTPVTIWERIGCSHKTIEFVYMSLADGILDDKEKTMLMRRVEEDGIDPQEFDFVLTKELEKLHKQALKAVKQLSELFIKAEAKANGTTKCDAQSLMAILPAIMGKDNPYGTSTKLVADAVSLFIKEPSKLNTFKAEIIRLIDIPLLPEVLMDFFAYASSQIVEERQRNSGKGLFDQLSEALFRKDIDLIPIWMEKMTHVMSKAMMRFGNSPDVMALLDKYRTSPLKELKNITDPQEIENFPLPLYASDYIELVKYSYEKGESVETPHREAYAHLNSRLLKASAKFINLHHSVRDVIAENEVRLVNIVMSNCDNPVFLVQLKTPDNLKDLLDVLNFLGSRKDLKKHHQRLYEEGLEIFSNDWDAIKQIKQFKPKNFLGF